MYIIRNDYLKNLTAVFLYHVEESFHNHNNASPRIDEDLN